MTSRTKTEIELTVGETEGIMNRCKVYKMGILDYPKFMERQKNFVKKIYAASIPVLESYKFLKNSTIFDIVTKYKFGIKDLTSEKHSIEQYCSCPLHLGTKRQDVTLDKNLKIKPSQRIVFSPDSIEKSISFVEDLIKDDIQYSKQKYREILAKNKANLSPNAGEIMAEAYEEKD